MDWALTPTNLGKLPSWARIGRSRPLIWANCPGGQGMAWDGHSKNNGFPVGRPLLLSPKPHDKIAEIGDSNRSQIAMKSVIGEKASTLRAKSRLAKLGVGSHRAPN
ncbi:unnamed protein product [Caenorhabditis nigoni]